MNDKIERMFRFYLYDENDRKEFMREWSTHEGQERLQLVVDAFEVTNGVSVHPELVRRKEAFFDQCSFSGMRQLAHLAGGVVMCLDIESVHKKDYLSLSIFRGYASEHPGTERRVILMGNKEKMAGTVDFIKKTCQASLVCLGFNIHDKAAYIKEEAGFDVLGDIGARSFDVNHLSARVMQPEIQSGALNIDRTSIYSEWIVSYHSPQFMTKQLVKSSVNFRHGL